MPSTPPLPVVAAAAMITIARLIAPAIPRAIRTSRFDSRMAFRRSSSLPPADAPASVRNGGTAHATSCAPMMPTAISLPGGIAGTVMPAAAWPQATGATISSTT